MPSFLFSEQVGLESPGREPRVPGFFLASADCWEVRYGRNIPSARMDER